MGESKKGKTSMGEGYKWGRIMMVGRIKVEEEMKDGDESKVNFEDKKASIIKNEAAIPRYVNKKVHHPYFFRGENLNACSTM
jgi:hypothetical protein